MEGEAKEIISKQRRRAMEGEPRQEIVNQRKEITRILQQKEMEGEPKEVVNQPKEILVIKA
jgi:hypothetical protein